MAQTTEIKADETQAGDKPERVPMLPAIHLPLPAGHRRRLREWIKARERQRETA